MGELSSVDRSRGNERHVWTGDEEGECGHSPARGCPMAAVPILPRAQGAQQRSGGDVRVTPKRRGARATHRFGWQSGVGGGSGLPGAALV